MKIPAIVLIVVFSIIPAVIIIIISLYDTNLMSYTFVGVENYREMWPDFKIAMKNTVWYLLLIPTLGLLLSVTIALHLADKPKGVQNVIRGGIYIPVFSAGVIIAAFWKWFFASNGFANWIVGDQVPWFREYGVPTIALVIVCSSMGSQVMLLSIAVNHINTDQYEAAIVDGASWWQIKFRIILPQLVPTISVIYLFSAVGAMQLWETIFMLAPSRRVASMMFRVFADGFLYGKYGIAAAECVVMLVIILMFGFIRERVLQKGEK